MDVAAREVVGVMGAGGSGRMTLLQVAAGLVRPDKGLVKVGR
jgi:molybdate transport system ATP-binding protein